MDNKEYFVKEMMQNFPESSGCLQCIKCKYDLLEFTFLDEEEDKKYNIDKEKLINTIPLIFTDKWGKGLTEVPANLFESTETVDNWLCQADAWDFDAFIQLSIFNEVIYG